MKINLKTIIVAMILALIMTYAYTTNKILIMFIVNLFIFIFIIFKAKLSLFSLKAMISFYVLLPVFFQHYTGESFGILELSYLSLETAKINLIIFLYQFINYLFISNTNILCYEKKIIERIEKINGIPIILFSLLAIVSIIIYFPPSFLSNGERLYHLLPGDFWNHLSVIFLLFLLPSLKRNKTILIPWIFVICWCFIKKERVDALGLLFLLLMIMYKKNMISRVSFIIMILCSFFALAFMGMTRIGYSIDSFDKVVSSVLIQSTSSDIAYILNISIHYVEDFGLLFGKTYLNYFVELLPIGTSSYDASTILNQLYGHPGGIYLLSEPYMNFGFFGVILYSCLECFFLNLILKKKNRIIIIYYFFFIVASFRYCWYGLRYLETGCIYLIPLIYFMYMFFKKSVFQTNENTDKLVHDS